MAGSLSLLAINIMTINSIYNKFQEKSPQSSTESLSLVTTDKWVGEILLIEYKLLVGLECRPRLFRGR